MYVMLQASGAKYVLHQHVQTVGHSSMIGNTLQLKDAPLRSSLISACLIKIKAWLGQSPCAVRMTSLCVNLYHKLKANDSKAQS